MAAGGAITVRGAARLAKTLHAAAQRVASELPTDETARIIQAAGRSYAPKRSGRLSGSVYASRLGPNAVQIGSPLVYAPVVHYGWRGHGITANPFLTNAARATEAVWFRRNVDHTQKILNTVRGE